MNSNNVILRFYGTAQLLNIWIWPVLPPPTQVGNLWQDCVLDKADTDYTGEHARHISEQVSNVKNSEQLKDVFLESEQIQELDIPFLDADQWVSTDKKNINRTKIDRIQEQQHQITTLTLLIS